MQMYKIVLGVLVLLVAGFCVYNAFSESSKAENLTIRALVELDKRKSETDRAIAVAKDAIALVEEIQAMTPFEFARLAKPGPQNIETLCDGQAVFLVGPGAKAANMQVIR